jgi:CheY-like chemotaxis protein
MLPAVPISVLVVDDIPLLRMAAGALLRSCGGVVPDFAENGYDAVARVLSARYDLVLMDVQMPVMDGVDAVRLIRLSEQASSRFRRVPIVAYTTHDQALKSRDAETLGFDEVLAKPADVDQMRACLARWCAASDAPTASIDSHLMALAQAVSCREAVAILMSATSASITPSQARQLKGAYEAMRQRLQARDLERVVQARASLLASRASLAAASAPRIF